MAVDTGQLGTSVEYEALRVKQDMHSSENVLVATEIPFTIIANCVEIATLMCTPSDLQALTMGFLFTSGFIANSGEVGTYLADEQQWRVDVSLAREPDPQMMDRRMYTSGCGKGVMYSSAVEISSRSALENDFIIDGRVVVEIMRWLQTCSQLHKDTGGVHTAALSVEGLLPQIVMDDVGRHNAVDKAIGQALMERIDFAESALVSTGRISSEILHKAKRSGIPIIVSRGAPTHQTVLMAREMNVTTIGFARGAGYTIFTCPQRVRLVDQGNRSF